jgi:hypothetical protein
MGGGADAMAYGGYLEVLTTGGTDPWAGTKAGFTIGGVNCKLVLYLSHSEGY